MTSKTKKAAAKRGAATAAKPRKAAPKSLSRKAAKRSVTHVSGLDRSRMAEGEELGSNIL